jgi:hypothetical protein
MHAISLPSLGAPPKAGREPAPDPDPGSIWVITCAVERLSPATVQGKFEPPFRVCLVEFSTLGRIVHSPQRRSSPNQAATIAELVEDDEVDTGDRCRVNLTNTIIEIASKPRSHAYPH